MSVAPTKKQLAALRTFEQFVSNEGLFAEQWPVIRQPRSIMNSLRERGWVELVRWIDDERGYELRLTPEGQRARDAAS